MKKVLRLKMFIIIFLITTEQCMAADFHAYLTPNLEATVSIQKNFIPAEYVWNFLKKQIQNEKVQNVAGSFVCTILIDALIDSLINTKIRSFRAWDSKISLFMVLLCSLGGPILHQKMQREKCSPIVYALGGVLLCSIIESLLRKDNLSAFKTTNQKNILPKKSDRNVARKFLQCSIRNGAALLVSCALTAKRKSFIE